MVAALSMFSRLIPAAALAQESPPDATDPPGVVSYEVVAGDTLSGIAQSFGITPETILWANGMSDGSLLKVGQKLKILPVSGVLHKVKAGESVLGIAAAYGVDADSIVKANQISDPSLVRQGDLLIVPGGVMKDDPGSGSTGSDSQEATTSYTVKPGDTLSSIAAAYGVQIATLRSANGLENSDLLSVGQQLSIPGATAPDQGTGAEREASSRGGQRDGKSFIATVTAYTIQGGTATGSHTRWGTVAVDPRVIPLGSKIRIDGFDQIFVAEDTGGGVRGNWVDIWFPDYAEALRFGMQSRRVTIVEP